jgi:hypothetical protein
MELQVLSVTVNCITLGIDRAGSSAARIYRARQASGRYEEIGTAWADTFKDTSDREAGRTYYYRAEPWRTPDLHPESGSWTGGDPVAATASRPAKQKRVLLTQGRQSFRVFLDGCLDESNTVTKGPEVYCPGPHSSMPPYEQVFEPNVYIGMENVGDADVLNPWVVVNGRRDWWSSDSIVGEVVDGRALTATEKALAIWRFVSEEVYDSRAGGSWFDDMADPVKLLNVYGFEGCVANAVASRRLGEAMGLESREVWLGGTLDGHGRGRLCTHDIFEARTDGVWHFLDTDMMLLFLRRDNQTVAGSEDLAQDLDLLRRSHRNMGLCGRDMPDKDFYYALFGQQQLVFPPSKGGVWTDSAGRFVHAPGEYPPPHTMALRLRPGEKLVRFWDNIGKNVVRHRRLHPDVRYSNGKLVYRPSLHHPIALEGLHSSADVVQEASPRRCALHPARIGTVCEAVWKVDSPYAIAGARVGFSCRRLPGENGFELLFSRDGQNWRSVFVACESRLDTCVELDCFLNPALYDSREGRDAGRQLGPCYAYYIKVAMWAGAKPDGVGLDSIVFDTDIQCATRSLPSLFCGSNTVSYRDDSAGDRRVRLTYGWEEAHSPRPPLAPELVYPASGADVDRLDFEFRWRRPARVPRKTGDFHVQVSRHPDFRWCVCPTFDRYVNRTAYAGRTRWQAEFPNLLNPDETYYWRVRARGGKGVWGTWSEVRAFTPHGPRHPIDLALQKRGNLRSLVWRPNPQGNEPAQYRIYGSMEPGGFSASPENLLGTVDAARLPLRSGGAASGISPRLPLRSGDATSGMSPGWPLRSGGATRGMSLRVVAVDSGGVPSTPSEYIVC